MKKTGILTAIIVISLLYSAASQVSPGDIESIIEEKIENSIQQENLPASSSTSKNPDNSINPETYYIGGGDKFTIKAKSYTDIEYEGIINSRGDIVIPDLGIIELNRVNLKSAYDTITSFVQNRVNDKEGIYAVLTGIKTATVNVTGAVKNPGTYGIKGDKRILYALKQANNDKNNTLPPYNSIDYRSIRVTRFDSVFTLDLFEYLYKDNLETNPYVYPGDIIYVPPVNNTVSIQGPSGPLIRNPVPIAENESAYHLLNLFDLPETADTTRIYLSNRERDSTIRKYNLGQLKRVTLKDKDIITISPKSNYKSNSIVNLSGEFNRPGIYPFTVDKTTIGEMIEMAGSINDLADPNRIYLFRTSENLNNISQNNPSEPPFSSILSSYSATRPTVQSAIKWANAAKDFQVHKLETLNSTKKIRKGDNIVALPKTNNIYISGLVENPGVFEFSENESARDLISRAGGYIRGADRSNITVIRNFEHRKTLGKRREELKPGDIVLVPEKPEFKGWNFFRSIITMVSSALSIIVTAATAKKILEE